VNEVDVVLRLLVLFHIWSKLLDIILIYTIVKFRNTYGLNRRKAGRDLLLASLESMRLGSTPRSSLQRGKW
jgi:hypothetical protein